MNALAGIVLLLWVAGPALRGARATGVRVAMEGTQPVLVGQQVRMTEIPRP